MIRCRSSITLDVRPGRLSPMSSPQEPGQEPADGTGPSASRDVAPRKGRRSRSIGRPVPEPIPRWVLFVGIPLMLLVAVGAVWLLLGIGAGRDQLDAVRTGGTIGVGFGGAVALWLAVRKQRSTELDLLQKYEAHELAERTAADTLRHQQEVAKDAREDSAARRITELYGKAADQLGSDKSAVRIAGLYGLERLAQDNPDPRLRQMIVNVISAYLRMPVAERDPAGYLADKEEAAVRAVALEVLVNHLSRGDNKGSVWSLGDGHWGELDLNLSGALLPGFGLRGFSLRSARFVGTEFVGEANFRRGLIRGVANFDGARFHKRATFHDVKVSELMSFRNAVFESRTAFNHCEPGRMADFVGSTFERSASFSRSKFMTLLFDSAEFHDLLMITQNDFERSPSLGGSRIYAGLHFIQNDIPEFDGFDYGNPDEEEDAFHLLNPAWVYCSPVESLQRRLLPDGLAIVSTDKRPEGETSGEWGRLVRITE